VIASGFVRQEFFFQRLWVDFRFWQGPPIGFQCGLSFIHTLHQNFFWFGGGPGFLTPSLVQFHLSGGRGVANWRGQLQTLSQFPRAGLVRKKLPPQQKPRSFPVLREIQLISTFFPPVLFCHRAVPRPPSVRDSPSRLLDGGIRALSGHFMPPSGWLYLDTGYRTPLPLFSVDSGAVHNFLTGFPRSFFSVIFLDLPPPLF